MRNKSLGKEGRGVPAVAHDSDIDLGEFMEFLGAKPTIIASNAREGGIIAFQLPAPPAPAPSAPANPMNPENIEEGDTVRPASAPP